jgi:hypothetical protein
MMSMAERPLLCFALSAHLWYLDGCKRVWERRGHVEDSVTTLSLDTDPVSSSG